MFIKIFRLLLWLHLVSSDSHSAWVLENVSAHLRLGALGNGAVLEQAR